MTLRLSLNKATHFSISQQTANCPTCGRFAKSSEERGYGGNFNQIWVTTHCSQCGTQTVSIV